MMKRESVKATVTQVTQLTRDIKSIHLHVDNKPVYKPGQFIVVSFTVNGKLERRTYSLASAPHWENIELIVKLHPNGKVSPLMHQLNVGDSLDITMPYGIFTLPDNDRDIPQKLVFTAHNVGLSAVLGILRHLDYIDSDADRTLIYVNPTVQDIVYKEELADLASKGLKLHLVITHDEDWDGVAGVDKEFLRSHCDLESDFFVHAPPTAATLLEHELEHLAVSKEKIHLDKW